MLHQIKDTDELKDYLSYQIEDAGLQVGVDPTLSEDEYIGIKVDDYYMGLRLGGETPKAVDFIVSVDCQCECYNLYVLELKNEKTNSVKSIETFQNIKESQVLVFDKTSLDSRTFQKQKSCESFFVHHKDQKIQRYKCSYCCKYGHIESFCFKKISIEKNILIKNENTLKIWQNKLHA